MENNILQQSNNKGIIIGKLKEKKITFATGKESGKAYAKGTLTVVVNTADGVNEIRVNVMQMALKKNDGGENGLYKALQTVNNEYKSILEVGEEQADTIKIEGSLEMNDYYNRNRDEVVSSLQVKGTIINRVDATSEHMAKFKIGGFIEDINNKEDNSVDVQMTSIAYGGKAFPVTVNVPKEGVPTFVAMFYQGCTADINFDMVNAVEVSKSVDNVGWGTGIDDIAERRVRVNRAFGGSVLPVGYTQDQIVQVKNIRQQRLETLLLEGREKSSQPTTNESVSAGFGVGFGNPTTPAQPTGFGTPAGGFGGSPANPFAK